MQAVRRLAALFILLFVVAAPCAPALAATGNECDSIVNLAYDSTADKGNLVVFVTFAGDACATSATPLYDGMDLSYGSSGKTRWQRFMERVDAMDGTRTFRAYLYEISGGLCNVKSYFPQTRSDGTYVRIELARMAAEYKGNDDLLMADVVAAFSEALPDYDASAADVDADGYIDNVMVVANSTGVFTSHANAATVAGTLGGKRVWSMTVLEGLVYQSGSLVTDAFSESTAVHEFMHRLGAPDLYRNSDKSQGGTPVGIWDVMSSGAAWSRPLAVTRELLGWTTLGEVDLGALGTRDTFTLTTANAGTQALVLRPDPASSEYFVMEYRKDAAGVLSYDAHLGASGLVVYRVNEKYAQAGNVYGQDYVYVFRPGETSLTASAGDVFLAPLASAAYATSRYSSGTLSSSIGSLDPDASFADGTVFYSDGTNSCLRISVSSQTDDSITVKVEYEPAQDGWSRLGEAATSAAQTDLAVSGDRASMLVKTGDGYAVRTWDGASWTQSASLGAGTAAAIEWSGDVLYAAVGSSSGVAVYAEKDGAWSQVAAVSASAPRRLDLACLAGSLYLSADSAGSDLGVWRIDASGATRLGSALPVSSAYAHALALVGGRVALVCGDAPASFGSAWTTAAYVYDGTSWSRLATLESTSCANSIGCATVDGTLYVAASLSGAVRVYALDASGSFSVQDASATTGQAPQGVSLATDGTDLVLSCVDGAGALTVWTRAASGATWTALGGRALSGATQGLVAIASDGVVAAGVTETGRAALRLFARANASIDPQAPAVQAVAMHRVYNPNSGEHFYTASTAEKDGLVKAGWRYEGIGWTAPSASTTPVYRLYSGTDHHYTVSESERDMLMEAGWSYEGVGWYSDDAKGVALYRQFNPNVVPTAARNNSGSHNYTASAAERDMLVSVGWIGEGIAWYGLA